MKKHYTELFIYNEWANHLAYKSIADTPGVSHRAHELISHIIASQKIWLSRATNKGDYPVMPWDQTPLDEIPLSSKQINEDWRTYVDRLSEEKFFSIIKYKVSSGDQLENRVIDIITHVINHSTYHRGQIAALVKAAGGKPAATDFIFYKRNQ